MSLTKRELAAILAGNPDIALRNAGDLGAPAERALERGQAGARSEHDEQCDLFAWADAAQAAMPELMLMFAIPNGGARHPAVAAQLKAEGVRRGVPDIFLAAIRRGQDGRIYGGLFVELKRADRSNHATPEQRAWIDALREAGYMAIVAYGADEAIAAITAYLAQ